MANCAGSTLNKHNTGLTHTVHCAGSSANTTQDLHTAQCAGSTANTTQDLQTQYPMLAVVQTQHS